MKSRRIMPQQLGSEAARKDLPRLLQEAERGRATVITRRGRAVAALVPMDDLLASRSRQQSLLEFVGSGKGLWGRDSRETLRRLRDEWKS
jgi:antitoxin (DNA-binding transcriptional repressor) of toxin-antitoxin stability system